MFGKNGWLDCVLWVVAVVVVPSAWSAVLVPRLLSPVPHASVEANIGGQMTEGKPQVTLTSLRIGPVAACDTVGQQRVTTLKKSRRGC